MVNLRRIPRPLGAALLVLYAVLLPLLITQIGQAHEFRNSNGRITSVVNRRLDYIDRTRYNYKLAEARLRWRIASTIAVSETDKRDRAEIRVSDVNDCTVNYIGRYLLDDRVRFNVCAMEWDGGFYPGTRQDLNSTPMSRRQRTAVHEFGHALGLDHNNLGDCSSILHSPVDFDQPTCWIPRTHDVNDMAELWH